MTGLDPDRDHIIELATVVTDNELREVAVGPELVLHEEERVLLAMDEWNTRQHTISGLLEQVRASTLETRVAESATLEFLRSWVSPNSSPMCGNSICQDRRFLFRHMPELERFFNYRNLDVSTLKELMQRWRPHTPPVQKQSAHRALQDVRDSISELRTYYELLFAGR